MNFNYWLVNTEPNNDNWNEHCVHIFSQTDFGWNDVHCDYTNVGFICEEHYHTTNYRQDMKSKNKNSYQLHTQLEVEFETTKASIDQIKENTRHEVNSLLDEWGKSLDILVDDFRADINELILKKPYLQVIIADIGHIVKELALEKQTEMANKTQQTRELIEQIHLNEEQSINATTSEFAVKLSAIKEEINNLLVY